MTQVAPLLTTNLSWVPVMVVVHCTTCTSVAEVLPRKLPSPLYVAVMLWLPTCSAADVIAALNVGPKGLVPRTTAPSRNVTVPVGAPTPGGTTETVAVNVTACPNVDGF